ncbi:LOW QUALITY PROTEIN: hypothetical protein V2J09_012281 [Rumex salicifolius]
MALVLNVSSPSKSTIPLLHTSSTTLCSRSQIFDSLNPLLRCNGKFVCLFSDNRKQEQARKALENALSGKKSEFEKWDEEEKKKKEKEEAGEGGGSGRGGWFGWGGWSGDDHFWQEAQQTSLAILGIAVMVHNFIIIFFFIFKLSHTLWVFTVVYLLFAKGDVMFATFVNPLLFVLRGARNSVTLATSEIMKMVSPSMYANVEKARKKEVHAQVSAKDIVFNKWGSS